MWVGHAGVSRPSDSPGCELPCAADPWQMTVVATAGKKKKKKRHGARSAAAHSKKGGGGYEGCCCYEVGVPGLRQDDAVVLIVVLIGRSKKQTTFPVD